MIHWKESRWNNVARFNPASTIPEGLLEQGIDIFEMVIRSMDKNRYGSPY
jgi:hypothetical protein